LNRLIVGCGYVGSEIARNWLAKGDSVYAITRSSRRVDELMSLGVYPVVWDWYRPSDDPSNPLLLPEIDSVVICVSHASVSGIAPEKTHTLGLDNLLHYWRNHREVAFPSYWCYVSTTGVYAPRDDGGWVDEQSEVMPLRPGSIAAKAAEDWLEREIFSRSLVDEASTDLLNGCILRAAGIYGPGRIPRLDSLRNNEPLAIDPESFLNLIHVVDLAGIVVAACDAPSPHRIYNVADGNPVRRRDYYEFIARQIGSLPPKFEVSKQPRPADGSVAGGSFGKPVARTRGEGSKRIRTDRLKESVAYPFQFPSFQDGLTPLLPK